MAILRVLQENGVQSAAGTEILRSQGGLEGMGKEQAVGPEGPECQMDQVSAAPASDLYEVTQPREEAEVVTDSSPCGPYAVG